MAGARPPQAQQLSPGIQAGDAPCRPPSLQIELECFRRLHEQESRGAPERIEALAELVAAQQRRERNLQERFKLLCQQRDDLLRARAQGNGPAAGLQAVEAQ